MPNAKSDFYNYGGAQTIKKGFIVTWSKSPIYLVFFVVVDLCNTSREDPFGNYREADLTKLFLSTSPPLVIDFFLCTTTFDEKKLVSKLFSLSAFTFDHNEKRDSWICQRNHLINFSWLIFFWWIFCLLKFSSAEAVVCSSTLGRHFQASSSF